MYRRAAVTSKTLTTESFRLEVGVVERRMLFVQCSL